MSGRCSCGCRCDSLGAQADQLLLIALILGFALSLLTLLLFLLLTLMALLSLHITTLLVQLILLLFHTLAVFLGALLAKLLGFSIGNALFLAQLVQFFLLSQQLGSSLFSFDG